MLSDGNRISRSLYKLLFKKCESIKSIQTKNLFIYDKLMFNLLIFYIFVDLLFLIFSLFYI